MKKVSDLLFYGREISYRIGDLYDMVESSRRQYKMCRDESKPFPFNYGITVDDIYYDRSLQYYIERMKHNGVDFSKMTVPKLPEDIYNLYSDKLVDVVMLQSLVRFVFRLESNIDGRNTSILDGDSKMVRLSDYCDFFLKIADYKCDIGTFIESLNIKLSAEKPWRFKLYDPKDIPNGYSNNLCTSCMTTNAENGKKTLQFYTMFDNIRLLVIEQDGQEVSRCLIWKVGKDKWIADRIYIYKYQVNMRKKVFELLDKPIEVYNQSKDANEVINIIDMRKTDDASFTGFMKEKIYASVQHLIGNIQPVTLSPFFDSARVLTIHKKYAKSITFTFITDTDAIIRKHPNRNIYIRDREETIMRFWTLFYNGKPVTNKKDIFRIGNNVAIRGELYLRMYKDGSITIANENNRAECSLIPLPNKFLNNVAIIDIKDFDNNPVDISTLQGCVKVWVDNSEIIMSKGSYILKRDAAFLVSKTGELSYILSTGSKVRATIVSKDELTNHLVLSRLYSAMGRYNDLMVFVEQEFARMTLDGSSVYIDDATKISEGMYCLYDTNLRGIENA